MDRRTALKRVGLLLGGTVSSSVVTAVLSGCVDRTGMRYTPQTLTSDQDALVDTLAELIIPETDTPGAHAAGVNVFVDRMLTHGLTDLERDHFMAGLDDVDARAQAAHGAPFVQITSEQQITLLSELEQEARESTATRDAPPFFHQLKELTLVGYYTSEIGATQELTYVVIPGRYDGDIPFAEVGRAYA